MIVEIWKPVVEYEGRYWISNLGRLKNAKRKILKPQLVNSGYMVAHLYKGGKSTRRIASVHRLVALAFVANPEQKPEVNHDDGVKTNNLASNLEWSTRLENVEHSIATGACDFSQFNMAITGVCTNCGEQFNFASQISAEYFFSLKKTGGIQHSLRRGGSAFKISWTEVRK